MAGITLSKEFGANPSVDHCFICNSELGVVLFGTAYKENGKTVKAPKGIVLVLKEDFQSILENIEKEKVAV